MQNIVSQMKRGTFNMRSVKLPPGAALFMAKGGAADTTVRDLNYRYIIPCESSSPSFDLLLSPNINILNRFQGGGRAR